MSNDEFTLKEMLTEVRMDMKEMSARMIRHEEVGIKTLEQATKTNGRVTVLEKADLVTNKRIDVGYTAGKTLAIIGTTGWAIFTYLFK